ncbi:response regulator [Ignatzschineria sp. RMDPL8A]|uniref:response regulator n=1 Tax=Ignatzschineria sp. RMDPL8A TaxID=2999236 RepID=UPI0016A8FF2C|nr:response regulator [Ignatzschineria sp. RMDPL8A]MDG9728832.1 response regulator [Ignatzschineria sp. RMDPL8A]NLD08238.1 response regulator [Xanthomonadaceae bacterium]
MSNYGLKVMVVDDSSTVRKTAELILKKENYEVVGIEDGFDALVNVSRIKPDIIFMDVMMPNLDGYDTCQILKSSPHDVAKIPIIMLTSKDGAFDKARGDLAGCDDFITKPFTRDEIVNAIERHS